MLRNVLIAAAVLFTAHASQAESKKAIPTLQQFVQDEVKHAYTALNSTSMDTATPGSTMQSGQWQFNRFSIEAYAKAGFHIPFLLKVEVFPELDLIWQREAVH